MKNKKILIINNGLASGGIERASNSFANYIAELDYKVVVLSLYKSPHFFNLDNRIVHVEPAFSRTTLNKYFYLIKMMLFVRSNIKKVKPDVILAYGEWTNAFVVLANYGLKTPIYLSDRMSPTLNLTRLHRFMKGFFYKRATGVIAQTSFAKEQINIRTGATNIKVIGNPVNCIEKVTCKINTTIVTVGRLSKEKGHEILIKAFSRIQNCKWKLSIVGDGPERGDLEKLVEALKISDRVIFHGFQKDFAKHLSESQIFVLPSLSEGFPNALIEAMSLPLACISSNCVAGPSDILENNVNGILVEPGNVDELANAIDRLIDDEALRISLAKEAYKIRKKLSFDKIAAEYLNFILEEK